MNKLVVVKASWCGPCKVYGPVVEAAKAEIEAKGYAVEFLDADENRDFCAEHGVRGVPATLIFKDGTVIESLSGAQTKDTLLSKLN